LFVLVADHGHHFPELRDMSGPEAHRVPLLLYGNVLTEGMKGRRIDVTGNHHDLPATLLNLLGMKPGKFPWSKDLLSPGARAFAFYEQDDGFGWIESDEWVYYSIFQKKTILKSDPITQERDMIHKGSAYLQKLYDQFLSF
jgi:phosphoglycerol transferase MdoB-like AlkP superfamily enzyme